jgi:electron transport complex protein RnfB
VTVSAQPAADAIDALLPQTQCTRCGYAGCRPYAEAIVAGEADINQCPPGGQVTIDALAALLGRPSKQLNPINGVEAAPRVAVIDETRCIGCAKCLPACPVDAIVGARRFMHTVIASQCNGCELCIAPCPVDCIHLLPALDEHEQPRGVAAWHELREQASLHRRRYEAHLARRAEEQEVRRRTLEAKKREAHRWRATDGTS